jgi:hypothetical protein
MLPPKYLQGIRVDPFDGCPGVFAAPDHRNPRSWRYLCSYADGNRHKVRIFALLEQHGQKEDAGAWELHHVVERQHFADVDFGARLPELYRHALPCVLIHRTEHGAYNRLLHIRATDEMFRDRLPRDLLERSHAAADAAGDPRQHPVLRQRVLRLKALYRDTYQGDPVLQRIAANVLDDTLQKLR